MERSSKTGLQLMELGINLLFFCIILTLCVQFFVRSYEERKESERLTFAVNEVCNLAEILISEDISLTEITEYYPAARVSQDATSATVFYDSDFKETDSENASYRMDVTSEIQGENTETNIDYFALDNDESNCLYSVNLFSHDRLQAKEGE